MLAATLRAGPARPFAADSPMPFGKHKGVPCDQVPFDYLRWALGNMDCCNPDHDRYWPEFVAVLEGMVGKIPFKGQPAPPRTNGNGHRPPFMPSTPAPPVPVVPKAEIATEVRGLLKKTYMRLSLQHHPDKGGSADAQAAVNQFYRDFQTALETWGGVSK